MITFLYAWNRFKDQSKYIIKKTVRKRNDIDSYFLDQINEKITLIDFGKFNKQQQILLTINIIGDYLFNV